LVKKNAIDSCVELPAVRGIQAGRQYYTVMCPLHAVTKLFQYSDSSLPSDIRAQRILNKQRVPEMCDYILNNADTYVFSALTASVDGHIEFQEGQDNYNIGTLKISLESRIILNVGQHRQAAISAALKKNPMLRNEDISIVIYHDLGLQSSQQMFTDLNRHAVRPTKTVSPLRTKSSISCNCGLFISLGDTFSINHFSILDSFKASICLPSFWSNVLTLT